MASITADRKGKQHFLLVIFCKKKKKAVIVPYSHIKYYAASSFLLMPNYSHYPPYNGCKNSVSTLG